MPQIANLVDEAIGRLVHGMETVRCRRMQECQERAPLLHRRSSGSRGRKQESLAGEFEARRPHA